MSLKLSAAEWCYCNEDKIAPDYYRGLKAIGINGVEMAPRHRYAAIRAAGLEVLNELSHSIDVGLNRRENHPTVIEKIRAAISWAKAERLPQCVVFSGNRAELDDATGKRNCVEALRQLAGEAEQAKVTLLLELLNSYDHLDYHADRSRFAFDVVREVASPNVKVLYDIYHMHRMGENVTRDVIDHLDWIGHLHIAGSPKRDLPGLAQEIDYRNVVRPILDAGYSGWWGIEFLPASGNALAELGETVELMRQYAKG